MRVKLPGSYQGALEIRTPLKGSSLYRTASELIGFYHAQFEMVFPPLNCPLLIYIHIRDLGLPGMFKKCDPKSASLTTNS
jgi:RNA polymerase I-specific transcription initiation factor RRN7